EAGQRVAGERDGSVGRLGHADPDADDPLTLDVDDDTRGRRLAAYPRVLTPELRRPLHPVRLSRADPLDQRFDAGDELVFAVALELGPGREARHVGHPV